MTASCVHISHQFEDSKWELPIFGNRLLIGWTDGTVHIDAGMPDRVAKVLAEAMAALGSTAWLSSEQTENTSTIAMERRLLEPLRRADPMLLVSSDTAPTVSKLFEAPGTDWSQRSQIAFTGVRDDPGFSEFDFDLAYQCTAESMGKLLEMHIDGILLPGVDGEVAGYYCFTEDGVSAFASSLDQAARQNNFVMKDVNEKQTLEKTTP